MKLWKLWKERFTTMKETFYFTTDMPTESFDELSPDQSIVETRNHGTSDLESLGRTMPKTFLDPQEELECRIALLEVAFQNHALEIRDRVAKRLEELEEKIEMQNSVNHNAIRDESKQLIADFEELSTSVANAIDRVESAAFAALSAK